MGILALSEWQGKWVRCTPATEAGNAACYLRSEVTLEPRFFAHTIGPILEIEGVSPLPELEEVSIVRVHGDLERTGGFEYEER